MHADRYEEYLQFTNNVPFVFHNALKRTRESVGNGANWHENFELQFCDSGEGFVLLDGKRIAFSAGEAVAVNSEVIHRTGTDKEMIYSCLIFDSAFCRRAGIDPAEIRFEEHFCSAEVRHLFNGIRNAYENAEADCRTAILQRLALSILIELRQKHTCEVHVNDSDKGYSNVKKAIRFIRMHYAEHLSLEDVARGIYANKYVLARQFKAATKQTVVSYINAHRCLHAAQMLEDGATVGEAARACGFFNLSFFTKVFQMHMGTLPKNWKK